MLRIATARLSSAIAMACSLPRSILCGSLLTSASCESLELSVGGFEASFAQAPATRKRR